MSTLPTTISVNRVYIGWRLDCFIVATLPSLSRSCVKNLIHSGHAWLQGRVAKPSEKVRAGDVVCIHPPKEVAHTSLVPEPRSLHILYEDSDILVVNKEAGIVVHPGAGNWRGSLAGAILAHCHSLSTLSGVDRPGIVHRLDKGTSGCLIIAKNNSIHHVLAQAFALRAIKKTYLAVVQGVCKKRAGTICVPICRHPVYRNKMSIAPPSKGRDAVTHYQVLASAQRMSVVACFPETGRTHQIRVHLKYLGHPIVGDATYGDGRSFQHHLLHAWKLRLLHPSKKIPMEFCATIPTEIMQLHTDCRDLRAEL